MAGFIRWNCILAALLVSLGAAAAAPIASTDPLVAVDLNRTAIVADIVGGFRERIANANPGREDAAVAALQVELASLRADRLLAASLASGITTLEAILKESRGARSAPASLARSKNLGDLTQDLVYTPLVPCRLIDTRGFGAPIQGGAFAPNERRNYVPNGLCGIPVSGVATLLVSFTTQNLTPNSGGVLAMLFPGAPITTTVDVFNIGSIWSASNVAVPAALSGQFDVFVSQASAHVIVDILGFFRAPFHADNVIVNDGSGANTVAAGAYGATIGGGGSPDTSVTFGITGYFCNPNCANVVTDAGGTVGGGFGNRAGNNAGTSADIPAPTVAGGMRNTASGSFSFVGGGDTNTASGFHSTVSGGSLNTASGAAATVVGGYSNVASGVRSVSVGGVTNIASGDFSFAAGQFASTQTAGGSPVVHHGAFVWADNSNIAFRSTASNQFSARATGGVRFVTAIDPANNGAPTAGVVVAAGGGSWASLSDVNAKADFADIDSREVLDKVSALPIGSWRYKSQDAAIRHIGPTAQDFHAAFGVGDNDTTITTVDADGVALAAIQGLNHVLRAKEARIRRLETALDELAREVQTLKGAAK